MQKTPVVQPAPALDDLAMHNRDLARRPAEAVEPDVSHTRSVGEPGGRIGGHGAMVAEPQRAQPAYRWA